jgi:hypothetical protein
MTAPLQPPPVSWRHTFLSWHLAKELRTTSDILVLEDLRHLNPAAAESLTPQWFFHGLPQNNLYQPVPLLPVDVERDGWVQREHEQQTGSSQVPFDLTAVLQTLRAKADERSILLASRSGAGKTVACKAALFECLVTADPQQLPRLSGFLPCMLRRLDGPNVTVANALLRTAFADRGVTTSPQMLASWLRVGPPLLLFVDLNAVNPKVRPAVVESLIGFLQNDDHRRVGHRTVVAYRSHVRDETLDRLRNICRDSTQASPDQRIFAEFDLKRVDEDMAGTYLRNLRWQEAKLCNEPVDEQAANAISAEVSDLHQLIRRYDQGEGSLISTPLLMYFVGMLGRKRPQEPNRKARPALADLSSLADLYDAVVEEFLQREKLYASVGPMPKPEEYRIAMCRLALAILNEGASTKLHEESDSALDVLFKAPHGGQAFLSSVPEFWSKSPYLKAELPPFQATRDSPGTLGNSALVQRVGSEVGFLHDSFLYYFAALAMRSPIVPDRNSRLSKVSKDWYPAVTNWWHEDPQRWHDTAELVGGMLTTPELHNLLVAFLTRESCEGWLGLLQRGLRGRVDREDAVLLQAERALSQHGPAVHRCWGALVPEVYHRLRDIEQPPGACPAFATKRLEPALLASEIPWLRSLEPLQPPLQSVRVSSAVTAIACLSDRTALANSEGLTRELKTPDDEYCGRRN